MLKTACMDNERGMFLATQPDWRYYPATQYSSHLPTIAPREEQILHAAYPQFSLSTISDVPRTRLPPRSRSGCWTCRMRKVKCDEGRPRCNQCTRLNHECDYSPKLAFKDETPKVIDKYLGSNSPLDDWDPTAELDASRESAPTEDYDDDLPAFNLLTNEEDWQRKAECHPPGTFFVVANSDSFADLEEYRASCPPVHTNENLRLKTGHPNISVDDATLILGVFEENPGRPSWRPDSGSTRSDSTAPTDVQFRISMPFGTEPTSALQMVPAAYPNYSLQDLEFSEPNLRLHYRSYIRRHLFRVSQDTVVAGIDAEDLFEREAAFCPPLHHALMALTALSVAFRNGHQNVHALEHYTNSIKSLANLHSEQELASNGQFLTHFILLLYEIAATEGFWTHHLESLKRIIRQRREILHAEPYPGIIWWICLIDISVLLSGSGKGEFVLEKVHDNTIPTAKDLRIMSGLWLNEASQSEDWDVLAPTFDFLREIAIQAAKIGALRVEIRELFRRQPCPPSRAQIAQLQQRVSRARDLLRQRWNSQVPAPLAAALGQKRLVGRARDAYEHASLIYNTCIIYTHTSMWSTQRRDTEPSHCETEINYAAQAILKLATDLVSRQHLQQRFAVFALFVTGMASSAQEDKTRAVGLLKAFEQESVGGNTQATRKFLEAIYARQSASRERRGNALDVDWIEVSEEMGQQIVNFGL